ncbi:hypothetical protein DXG03_003733 [Asterophora parasitica]|uniref:MARVEL domain-containing protein n=1 Tax=Asterophora parasitica TaxID=117018 RepID=A0A9P7KBQ8_9AGAR|nr:hypothetical protein DXG03_003733 [Asterophora parasitica]
MGVLDSISDLASRFSPAKLAPKQHGMAAGIGHGGNAIAFDDNMIVSKPTIVFHASQIFFNFLAMACFASVASFQSKWKIGPSGLSGFALFISIAGIFLSTFMLLVPVIYEKYDKGVRLARALKEVRVGFILTGGGTGASLLIAFITTISAWTQPGCKNPDKDPHEDLGDDFKNALGGWCSTKKAAAIFFWLAFASWVASLTLLILDWRSGKLHTTRARDPPFTHPEHDSVADLENGEDDDEDEGAQAHQQTSYPTGRYDPTPDPVSSPFADPYAPAPSAPSSSFADPYAPSSSSYTPSYPTPSPAPAPNNNIPAGRPSMDAYGAFSDPAPSGFAAGVEQPRVSRTMQYADPYAAVRASVQAASTGGASAPPSYEGYVGGYR